MDTLFNTALASTLIFVVLLHGSTPTHCASLGSPHALLLYDTQSPFDSDEKQGTIHTSPTEHIKNKLSLTAALLHAPKLLPKSVALPAPAAVATTCAGASLIDTYFPKPVNAEAATRWSALTGEPLQEQKEPL